MNNLLLKAESKFSDRHMVSAGHHLAADAAREILDAGGNAADAGVCGGICLAVLLSEYVNFADDGYHPLERDTSFVCAVDTWGNCFAATPSDVNSTAPVVPGTGLIPSPRGNQSFEDPSHPACLAPGKRPRLTPNPAIVINPGQWAMPLGTPGNDVQTQAMVEVLLNTHLHRMSVQGAIKK